MFVSLSKSSIISTGEQLQLTKYLTSEIDFFDISLSERPHLWQFFPPTPLPNTIDTNYKLLQENPKTD